MDLSLIPHSNRNDKNTYFQVTWKSNREMSQRAYIFCDGYAYDDVTII